MRKRVWGVVIISGILVVCGGICLFYFFGHKEKQPEVVADLCYERGGSADSLIYVTENGEYVPYVVIDTGNYGDDAVLLMRKDVVLREMMYRDEKAYGAGGAYYVGSVVDDFLEGEFYRCYSPEIQSIVRNSPVKIHTRDYVSKRTPIGESEGPVWEVIFRHVFVLSAAECGGGMAVYNDAVDEGKRIPEIEDFSVKYYTWLRSELGGGDDTHGTLCYDGKVVGGHISAQEGHYIRPVITVSRNEAVVRIKADVDSARKEIYVFLKDKR